MYWSCPIQDSGFAAWTPLSAQAVIPAHDRQDADEDASWDFTCAKMASLRRRPAMVVNSPGTHRMTSCPTRRIWMSTIAGCLQTATIAHTSSDFYAPNSFPHIHQRSLMPVVGRQLAVCCKLLHALMKSLQVVPEHCRRSSE